MSTTALGSQFPVKEPRPADVLLPEDFDNDAPGWEAEYDKHVVRRKAASAAQHDWDDKVGVAMSKGQTTLDEAEKRGYQRGAGELRELPNGDAESAWGPMPKTLYHVSTDVPAVLRDGLKSRKQLGQSMGTGLGGGANNTVSFTADPEVAGHILSGLHRYHSIVSGRVTPEQVMKDAASGADSGGTPYHEDLKVPSARAVQDNPHEALGDFASNVLAYRELAGGPTDPLFMFNNPKALAEKDPAKFGIVKAENVGGRTHGFQMGALGEWRTHHTGDLRVERHI